MTEILVDGRPIEISYYPDGSPRIVFNNHIHIKNIGHIVLRPKRLNSFLASMFFLDALKHRNISINKITIPFIIGSRQDRLTNGEDEDFLFTAKSICEEINKRTINTSLQIFDPHSDVISACLNNVSIKSISDIFSECNTSDFNIKEYDGIICPDTGAEKKCLKVAKKFGIDSIIFCSKSRDIKTGKINNIETSRFLNLKKDGKYIVVDDICDGGATFIELSNALKNNELTKNIKIDLYVTHGIFSKGTWELKKNYNKIFCTDSVISHKDCVNVINFFGENS